MNKEEQVLKRVLSKRGYTLLKKELTKKQIQKIRKELTVKPFVNQKYGPPPTPFPVYLESVKKLYLPRHYGVKSFGKPHINKITSGDKIDVTFIKTLRQNQKPIVKTYMKAAHDAGGGLICVPCGYGKTVIALNILAQLKRKTLIVVHKTFLMNQWKERIDFFLKNARVGKIQGKTLDIINKNIVIGMLQTLSMKEFPPGTFDEFGLVIYDECHHVSAEVFSRALPKTASMYMLGLTATPKRKDGLSKVFEWYIGDVTYSIEKRKEEEVEVRCINYIPEKNTDKYNKEIYNFKGTVSMPQMITNICSYMPRTDYITNVIKEYAKIGRKILILSDRREHLKDFKGLLDNEKYSSGYYVGGMKQKDLKISEEKQILLATYSMASEGFDVPSLNTLILASPKSDIVQASGRILRQRPEDRKFCPIIVDIIDNFSLFSRQAIKRKRMYKRNNYNIKYESNISEVKSNGNNIPKGTF